MSVLFASYGNDSVALIQWAHESGLKDVYVLYSNTGWAAKHWPKRVAKMEAWARSLGFTPVQTKSIGMEQLVMQRKAWPRQGMQFCTTELKMVPALEWLEANDPLGLAVCMVGVRREESKERASFPSYLVMSANHGDRALRAPLADYTEDDRDALLARAGIEPLPHRSKECSPCVNANRSDLLTLDEDRVDHVEGIEQRMGTTRKGKPRTMFRPYRHMGATGIRQIIKWAKSARGKFSLDDGNGQAGCDSGMCGI